MTDFTASTILVLANASGDVFIVDYLYGGEYKYRIKLKSEVTTQVHAVFY